MRPPRWTPEQDAWLRESYPVTPRLDDLAALYAGAFPEPRTPKALRTRAKVLGLRKAVRCPHRHAWSGDRAEWFKAFCPGHTESEISAEHARLFGSPLTKSQVGNAKMRYGVRSGTVGGRFEKGTVPPNKGKKWADFMSPEGQERSRATCYKPGNMPDNGARLPVGSERVDSKDGYLWRKVAERPSRPDCNDNWRLVHHLVWEQANGRPVPPSTMIVFADRDKSNFDPANLVAVPRALWVRITQLRMEYGDRESLEACMARAALHAKMGEMKRRLA
ncbi:MAG TPA: hypothetical protein DCP91_08600 [Eggerthellaceae bacterium]|nr:hypothetical protein [Eggerthellaceae bacterium]